MAYVLNYIVPHLGQGAVTLNATVASARRQYINTWTEKYMHSEVD